MGNEKSEAVDLYYKVPNKRICWLPNLFDRIVIISSAIFTFIQKSCFFHQDVNPTDIRIKIAQSEMNHEKQKIIVFSCRIAFCVAVETAYFAIRIALYAKYFNVIFITFTCQIEENNTKHSN